jgi:hypothetical protein
LTLPGFQLKLIMDGQCLVQFSLKSGQGQPWPFWKCSSVVIFEVIDELVTSCLPCISIFAEIRARSWVKGQDHNF